jgi:hypothetical protein
LTFYFDKSLICALLHIKIYDSAPREVSFAAWKQENTDKSKLGREFGGICNRLARYVRLKVNSFDQRKELATEVLD